MIILPTGDLARHIILRQQMADVKAGLLRHSNELATGRAIDPGARVKGDFTTLAGIERGLERLKAFKMAATEATLITETLQNALDTTQAMAVDVGNVMLSVASLGQDSSLDAATLSAKDRFATAVSALNMQVAGRTLLAGAATAGPALLPAEDILAALTAATTGAASLADFRATVETWFAAGNAYLGSAQPMSSFTISETESIQLTMTAADPAIGKMLSALALGALLDHPDLAGQTAQRAELAKAAGESLLSNQGPFSALRATLGLAESRVEAAVVRNGVETTTLTQAREAQIGVDQFDSGTQLEAAQTQLETLYAVTARMSRLSLADFLR
ncbi:flagellin [Plastorhodobacter daqingensis]|uniref:Flagellin n=1 Tax=Plastorhodobacter daqingensis TaxID=1387281 RepID=A0ABW2UD55_9RHOB